MAGTLLAKCAKIKKIRLPHDSIDDYEHKNVTPMSNLNQHRVVQPAFRGKYYRYFNRDACFPRLSRWCMDSRHGHQIYMVFFFVAMDYWCYMSTHGQFSSLQFYTKFDIFLVGIMLSGSCYTKYLSKYVYFRSNNIWGLILLRGRINTSLMEQTQFYILLQAKWDELIYTSCFKENSLELY